MQVITIFGITLSVDTWIGLATSLATWVYVIIVLGTFFVILRQLSEFRKNRKLQTALALFSELQTKEVREARRYIYEQIPQDLLSISDEEIKKHIAASEEAVKMLHRVGYLLSEGHIDPHPIVANYWPVVWRCWRKTEHFVQWVREKRGNPNHLFGFEHLYKICEEYRQGNNFQEPKFY